MLTLEQRVRPHPEVVDTMLDGGEVVLLHLESKTYYSLNLTGERIWQRLKQGLTLKEISQFPSAWPNTWPTSGTGWAVESLVNWIIFRAGTA